MLQGRAQLFVGNRIPDHARRGLHLIDYPHQLFRRADQVIIVLQRLDTVELRGSRAHHRIQGFPGTVGDQVHVEIEAEIG